MIISAPGLLGALLFLIFGIVELAIFTRSIYPVLAERHERLKVTQEQGRGPALLARFVRIQSLVVMPIAGYVLGQMLSSSSPGAT
ncbi:MAG: hypothetical protein LCH46_13110 [Proteobacteria bacterium]|nr:hypothetical protein [Pseudomonadota bacterium]